MTQGSTGTAVIYLSYVPYGTFPLSDFIRSYNTYDAGTPHSLIILFKGMKGEVELTPFFELLKESGKDFSFLCYYGGGFDIHAYSWAAGQLQTECLFFLNTRSVLLAGNWLHHYMCNFSGPTGIISATASQQSYYSSVFQKNKFTWEHSKGFLINFRKVKLFLKAFFYWRFLFSAFPNPHVRTNAFLVRRKDFLQIRIKTGRSKFKAYLTESGRKSITAYFMARGLDVLVVDRFGKTYDRRNWASSATFWIREQENLLIADNQTMLYERATAEEKSTMTKLAWGEL